MQSKHNYNSSLCKFQNHTSPGKNAIINGLERRNVLDVATTSNC